MIFTARFARDAEVTEGKYIFFSAERAEKKKTYDLLLRKKYKNDFNQFSLGIKNKATLDQKDDWMDWKSAIEMRLSWNNVQKMIINNK